MKEFEIPFRDGLRKGLRKDKSADRNEQGLITCLNTKPAERGPIPIVPVTYSISSTVSWPYPQMFELSGSKATATGLGPCPNSVLESLEFDADTGTEISGIHLDGDYYAVIYCGPDFDGFLKTYKVSVDGNIGSVIDTWEFGPVSGQNPILFHVSGSVYALADRGYYGVRTLKISGTGIITKSFIDTLVIGGSPWFRASIVHVASNVYAIFYEYSANRGYLSTFTMETDGTLGDAVIETKTSGLGNKGSFATILEVTSNVFVICNDTSSYTTLMTIGISDAGDIDSSVIETVNVSTPGQGAPSLVEVTANMFAVAYGGVDGDGFISTYTVSDAGDISDSAVATYEFDTSDCDYPRIVSVGYGDYFMVVYRGTSNVGIAKTVRITDAGAITAGTCSSLEFEGSACTAPFLFSIESNFALVAYQGPGDDGWMKTLEMGAIP